MLNMLSILSSSDTLASSIALYQFLKRSHQLASLISPSLSITAWTFELNVVWANALLCLSLNSLAISHDNPVSVTFHQASGDMHIPGIPLGTTHAAVIHKDVMRVNYRLNVMFFNVCWLGIPLFYSMSSYCLFWFSMHRWKDYLNLIPGELRKNAMCVSNIQIVNRPGLNMFLSELFQWVSVFNGSTKGSPSL